MANKDNGTDWLSWGIGILGGVVLWNVVKPKPAEAVANLLPPPVQDLPATASPARFANLGSVSLRIDQVKKLFRLGQMSPEQALSEAESLAAAANSFSLERGEDATVIYAQALALQEEIMAVLEKRRFLI
jgi:hypothetical protein